MATRAAQKELSGPHRGQALEGPRRPSQALAGPRRPFKRALLGILRRPSQALAGPGPLHGQALRPFLRPCRSPLSQINPPDKTPQRPHGSATPGGWVGQANCRGRPASASKQSARTETALATGLRHKQTTSELAPFTLVVVAPCIARAPPSAEVGVPGPFLCLPRAAVPCPAAALSRPKRAVCALARSRPLPSLKQIGKFSSSCG